MISENSAFDTAIFEALCACLNLNSNSADAIALIHKAYAEPENVPRPARTKNVIYWTVQRDQGADSVSTSYQNDATTGNRNLPHIYTTLKYQLIIVCYGPASESYAMRIRHMLYLDGSGFPRRILRNAGIFPIPDPPQPDVLHEEEGSLWRKRTDLTITLRVREEETAQARGSVAVAPTVIIRR